MVVICPYIGQKQRIFMFSQNCYAFCKLLLFCITYRFCIPLLLTIGSLEGDMDVVGEWQREREETVYNQVLLPYVNGRFLLLLLFFSFFPFLFSLFFIFFHV